MAFGVTIERATKEMAKFLATTDTNHFFWVSMNGMRNLVECNIVAVRFDVRPDGIHFPCINHLVTNAKILATLCLQAQDGGYILVESKTFLASLGCWEWLES